MVTRSFFWFVFAAGLVLLATGCASSTQNTAAAAPGMSDMSTASTASAGEGVSVSSDVPLSPGPIRLWMHGLSCPLCATNIDQQLGDLPGVRDIKVDLKTGLVTAAIVGERRPSARQIAEAAELGGVTLVKIER